MECKICEKELAKYKCPNCRIKYCGLDCWKIHKSKECEKFIPQEEKVEEHVAFPSEDTLPPLKLLKLCNREIKEHLKDNQLRKMILEVDASDNPNKAVEEAMKNSTFLEFVNICLRYVDPDEVDQLVINMKTNYRYKKY